MADSMMSLPAQVTMKISQAIRKYLTYSENKKNHSRHTLESYELYFKRFFEWTQIKKIKNITDITPDTINDYRHWLSSLHPNTPLKKSSQNYHLIALRSLVTYLTARGVPTLAAEKIQLASMPPRSISVMNDAELVRLLSIPSTTADPTIIKRRDGAILELFFDTGLRISELASLRRNCMRLSKNSYTIRKEEGVRRPIPLSSHTQQTLQKYLDTRTDKHNALFIRHDRASQTSFAQVGGDKTHSLTPRSIQRLVQKYAKMAGVTQHITPRGLRHSFAVDRLAHGTDIETVQKLLGHAQSATTKFYTQHQPTPPQCTQNIPRKNKK